MLAALLQDLLDPLLLAEVLLQDGIDLQAVVSRHALTGLSGGKVGD